MIIWKVFLRLWRSKTLRRYVFCSALAFTACVFISFSMLQILDEAYVYEYEARVNKMLRDKIPVEQPHKGVILESFLGRVAFAGRDRDERMLEAMLARASGDLQSASELMRKVLKEETDIERKALLFYRLGRMLVELKEVQGGVELMKESLRHNPYDLRVKFDLERLYHFMLRDGNGGKGQASLEQAPGIGRDGDSLGGGMGRSSPKPGI
jgi:hypothetical protein